MRTSIIPALVLAVLASACGAGDYDIVIQGGRVMDPESGLDAVMNVGVRDGRIEAVSEDPLEGARTIDASGLVVAPGFVDLHEHGQMEEAYALMVADGVTSAFELEVGTGDVDAWYQEREDLKRPHGFCPVAIGIVQDAPLDIPAIAQSENAFVPPDAIGVNLE